MSHLSLHVNSEVPDKATAYLAEQGVRLCIVSALPHSPTTPSSRFAESDKFKSGLEQTDVAPVGVGDGATVDQELKAQANIPFLLGLGLPKNGIEWQEILNGRACRDANGICQHIDP